MKLYDITTWPKLPSGVCTRNWLSLTLKFSEVLVFSEVMLEHQLKDLPRTLCLRLMFLPLFRKTIVTINKEGCSTSKKFMYLKCSNPASRAQILHLLGEYRCKLMHCAVLRKMTFNFALIIPFNFRLANAVATRSWCECFLFLKLKVA